MLYSVLLCTISVLILARCNGIQGKITNFPTKFRDFPRVQAEDDRPIVAFDETYDDESLTDHDDELAPGYMRFGDLILSPEQVQQRLVDYIHEDDREPWMQVWIKDATKKWNRGVVPYTKHSSLTAAMETAVDDAVKEYNDKLKGCIQLKARTTETDYVEFKKGTTCQSQLGRVGGKQAITSSDNCYDKVVVMHEIMHALGRDHEHQRSDRDCYVTVNWGNIVDGHSNSAFTKFAVNKFNTQGIEYDLKSIVHYPKWADRTSGTANMTPKPNTGVTEDQMGAQHPGGTFSATDIKHVKQFYGCS